MKITDCCHGAHQSQPPSSSNSANWAGFLTNMHSSHIYSIFFSYSWNRISCIWLWAFWVCKDALYLVPAVNNVYTVYDILLLCLIPKSTSPSTFTLSACNLKSSRKEMNEISLLKEAGIFFCILQILCMKMMKLNLPEKKPLIATPLSKPWTPYCPTVQCSKHNASMDFIFYTPVLCSVHIPQHLCQFTHLCVLRGRSVVCLFSLQELNAKENVSSQLEWWSMINQEITAN